MLLCNQDVHLLNYLTMNSFGDNSGAGSKRHFAPELLTFNTRVYVRFDIPDQQKSPQKTRFVSS
jgi:hypothetical protein